MQATAFARVFLQRPSSPATCLPLPPSLAVPLACSSFGISRRHERSNAQHDGGNRNSERSSSPSSSVLPLSLSLFSSPHCEFIHSFRAVACHILRSYRSSQNEIGNIRSAKVHRKKRSEPRKNCTPHINITRLRIELDRDTSEEGRLVDGGGGHGNWCLSIG